MALAFKTLLLLAPLLAVIFSILKGFGVHTRMGPTLAEALAPLGEKGQDSAKFNFQIGPFAVAAVISIRVTYFCEITV
jgi:hypothetical protein